MRLDTSRAERIARLRLHLLAKSDTPAAKRARRLISKIKRRCRKGYLGYEPRQEEFLFRTTCGAIRDRK